MTAKPSSAAARLRGLAAGLLTATLAVAAHGIADGAAPTGASVVFLAVLAATIGAVTANFGRTSDVRVLLGLLAAGQLVGHLMLSVAGHSHGGPTSPAPAMLVAHALAVAVGATLIAAVDRLCRTVSRAVQGALRAVVPPIAGRPVVVTAGADQPLVSRLLLAASVSHRGPPVSRTS